MAFPIANILMNQWLRNYPYRTELSWWIFLISGSATLLIALFTIAFQVYRAARTNPVQALRYE